MKETKIEFNTTYDDCREDKEKCKLIYSVSFENFYPKDTKVFIRTYIPKELEEAIVYKNEDSVIPVMWPLKMENNFGIGKSVIINHLQTLNIEDRKILMEHKDYIYVYLAVGNKQAFIRIDANNSIETGVTK